MVRKWPRQLELKACQKLIFYFQKFTDHWTKQRRLKNGEGINKLRTVLLDCKKNFIYNYFRKGGKNKIK